MKLSQKAKYFTFGIVASAVVLPLAIYAVETIPVTFSEGDVISAGVINSLFNRVNNISKLPVSTDFIGTWNCKETRSSSAGINGPGGNFIVDASGLFGTRDNKYTFSAVTGTNTLLLTTDNGFPLRSVSTPWTNITVAIAPRTRILTANAIPENVVDSWTITGMSSDVFEMSGVAQPNSATCYKANTPPAPADALQATVTGTTTVLTWTDQSTDETGFKVQRKTSVTGAWTDLTTTAANAVAYTDSTVTTGTYWYRVLATNVNGDSMSSSEVQAVLP